MTFLAPIFLMAAAAIAAGVVALHFIVTRQPRMVPLPTARFAPDHAVRAQTRAIQPQDLLLLALRVAMILAIGAALAQPVLRPPRRALARIVLADRSRAVASAAEVADSARVLLGEGDALVLFDAGATTVRERPRDSLDALASSGQRGRLSTALIAGLRAASDMREAADSFELAIVSPLVEEEVDDATDSLRALWPGVLRLVHVAPRVDTSDRRSIAFEGAGDDPLRYSLPPREGAAAGASVRIVRDSLSGADSTWVREGARALVYWPAAGNLANELPVLPDGWTRLPQLDTTGAVSAAGAVVVAPFQRYASFAGAVNDIGATGGATRGAATSVVARWVDGQPAAVEAPYGEGCIRGVTIPVPVRGDLVLQARFIRLVSALTGPCGGTPLLAALDNARLDLLAGPPGAGLTSREALPKPVTTPLPLVPWLLAAALLFAVAALLVRRRAARTRSASTLARAS